MSHTVVLYLDFDHEPTSDDVAQYVQELNDDGNLHFDFVTQDDEYAQDD